MQHRVLKVKENFFLRGLRRSSLGFAILSLGLSSGIHAQTAPDLNPETINPILSEAQENAIEAFYRKASSNSFVRNELKEIRRKLIADPRDQKAHEVLNASPELTQVILATWQEIRSLNLQNRMMGLASSSRANPNTKGPSGDVARQMQKIDSLNMLYLFPADGESNTFLQAGGINAFTGSGDPYVRDIFWLDGLLDLTQKEKDARLTIGGHEKGHIFFEHILDRIGFDLIFHSLHKNLIPSDVVPPAVTLPASSKEKLSAAEALMVINARKALEWKRKTARELIPHLGERFDENPSFVDQIVSIMDVNSEKLEKRLGKEGVKGVATQLYRAAQGLAANAPVPAMDDKTAEKLFEQAMTNLSRGHETSADNMGRLATELLAKDPERASTQAFIYLMGSKYGDYDDMKAQIAEYLLKVGTAEGKAFASLGGDHPNVVARAAAMYSFADQHESMRIIKNPFLTLLSDYMDLTARLVSLDQAARNPDPAELLPRQISNEEHHALGLVAAQMSDMIEDVIVNEVVQVQQNKSPNISSTLVLLGVLEKTITRGARSSRLVTGKDMRLALGMPDRVGVELVAKLKKARADLGLAPASTNPFDTKESYFIDDIIGRLEALIPPLPTAGYDALVKKAAAGGGGSSSTVACGPTAASLVQGPAPLN